MLSLKGVTTYQSVLERVREVPGGLPLRRRSVLPEHLSTAEVANLLYEIPEDEESIKTLLEHAMFSGELHARYSVTLKEPVDPQMVIRNLHSHIRQLEKELREFEKDVRNILHKNIREIERDIYNTRESVASAIDKHLSSSSGGQDSVPRLKKRGSIFGGLLDSKSQLPIRSMRSIAYRTNTQSVLTHLVDKDDLKKWLKSKGEWPLDDETPLSRWYSDARKGKDGRLTNAIREDVLKRVAIDLKAEGIEPLAYPGQVAEIFDRCREKSLEVYGNTRAFTQLSTWRSAFWNSGKKPNHKGIIELADPKSRKQRS